MFQRARGARLSVPAREYRAVRVVEYLGCGRAKQHLPEKAGVRGHHDEIEFAVSGNLSDLGRSVPGSEDSRTLGEGKFRGEEGVESVAANEEVLFSNFRRWPQVEFKASM